MDEAIHKQHNRTPHDCEIHEHFWQLGRQGTARTRTRILFLSNFTELASISFLDLISNQVSARWLWDRSLLHSITTRRFKSLSLNASKPPTGCNVISHAARCISTEAFYLKGHEGNSTRVGRAQYEWLKWNNKTNSISLWSVYAARDTHLQTTCTCFLYFFN